MNLFEAIVGFKSRIVHGMIAPVNGAAVPLLAPIFRGFVFL